MCHPEIPTDGVGDGYTILKSVRISSCRFWNILVCSGSHTTLNPYTVSDETYQRRRGHLNDLLVFQRPKDRTYFGVPNVSSVLRTLNRQYKSSFIFTRKRVGLLFIPSVKVIDYLRRGS